MHLEIVVIEVNQVTFIQHRLESEVIDHIKSHFASTTFAIVTTTPPHSVTRPVVVVKRAHGREVGALGEVVEGRGGRPAREHGRQAAGAAVTAKEERVRVCCCLSCVVKVTRQGVTGAVRRRHV